MLRTLAQSQSAAEALGLVSLLQQRFTQRLSELAQGAGAESGFQQVEWLRDAGRHGGGVRFAAGDTEFFDRASVNVSQVHYDDDASKRLGSATALSAIIHPRNPLAPSVHIHISWTEMKSGTGYWRMMADLNPAIVVEEDRLQFEAALRAAAPDHFQAARSQGDRYFHIPALDRHRGVTHFYLEGYSSDRPAEDQGLARAVGEAAIDSYVELLKIGLLRSGSQADQQAQLAYHTLYLFQVLTLDRGTSAGLLVHDQNDIGILGSLPSHVDKQLLASWRSKLPAPQDELLTSLLEVLADSSPSPVSDAVKADLAERVRRHYQTHPEALSMQASGDTLPPTVENHQPPD